MEWFDRIGYEKNSLEEVDFAEFVGPCALKQIKYDFDGQREILPNLITLAGILDAILIEETDETFNASNLVFDAVDTFGLNHTTAYEATEWMYERYINSTTGLAKMNPGLDVHSSHHFNPPLDKSIDFGLSDYIVKERLFTFFLNDGCIPLTKEHGLVEKIVTNNPWTEPITVFGYDDTFALAGDLFEAETDCVKEHNLGQVASNGCTNLAYYSSLSEPITTPMLQNRPVHNEAYNKSKTYIGLVIGDGDNVNFIKGSRASWMNERISKCESGQTCFPLIWTLSPALRYLAPDWARWFFEQANRTGSDYFILPPSGHTYSYPGQMPEADQNEFVKMTEEDCVVYNTSVSVSWEFFGTWKHALDTYYPKYNERNIVRGFVPVNVPYMFPIVELLETKYSNFEILGDDVVMFKPNEWRGSRGGNPKIPFDHDRDLPAKDMADKINKYKPGTVEAIYITSDGGANLDLVYNMTGYLEEHVEIVSHETLTRMAASMVSSTHS